MWTDLVLAVALLAQPEVEIQWYPVTGRTLAELGAARHSAMTHWTLRWNWPGDDEVCQLDQAKVTVTIQVELPDWTPPPDADVDVLRAWRHYLTALAEHEAGHVAIALLGRLDAEEVVRGATCGTAEGAVLAVLATAQAQEAEYDKITRHGAAQGARLYGK